MMEITAMNKTALLILFVLLCAGCSRRLDKGEVVGKSYDPPYSYIAYMPIATSCGNNCTTVVQVPYVVSIDEAFKLKVRGSTLGGEVLTETWFVSKQVYEQATVGRVKASADLKPNYAATEKLTECNL